MNLKKLVFTDFISLQNGKNLKDPLHGITLKNSRTISGTLWV
jgi:hypothetical protein